MKPVGFARSDEELSDAELSALLVTTREREKRITEILRQRRAEAKHKLEQAKKALAATSIVHANGAGRPRKTKR